MTQKTHTGQIAGQIFPLGVTQPCRETVFECWLRYYKQELVNLYTLRDKSKQHFELLEFAAYVFDCDRGVINPELN